MTEETKNIKIIALIMVIVIGFGGFVFYKKQKHEKEILAQKQEMIRKSKQVTFEKILSHAKTASNKYKAEEPEHRLIVISETLSADGLVQNTSENVEDTKTIKKAIKYITEQYANGTLSDNAEENFYITEYIVSVTKGDLYFNSAYNMCHLMYQLCMYYVLNSSDYSSIEFFEHVIDSDMNSFKSEYDFLNE